MDLQVDAGHRAFSTGDARFDEWLFGPDSGDLLPSNGHPACRQNKYFPDNVLRAKRNIVFNPSGESMKEIRQAVGA